MINKKSQEYAESLIGNPVIKESGKPFKSRNKINTVKGVTINPHTSLPALVFNEDDSIVDAHQCINFNESDEPCLICEEKEFRGGCVDS
jgi:hypothetical protein